MKSLISFTRVTIFLILSFFLLEWIIDSGDKWAIVKYPIVWGVLGLVLFLAIVFEIMLAAMERVLFKTMDKAAQHRFVSAEERKQYATFGWFERTYEKILGS